MDTRPAPAPADVARPHTLSAGRRAPLRLPASLLLALALGAGGLVGACADTADHATMPRDASATSTTATRAPSAGVPVEAVAVPLGAMTMPTSAEVTATWKARPAYVENLAPDWQAAYAFALARPDVLQWLPCYCGCAGMEHRSNLDCFFVRREVKGTYQYEEHASFCDICVQTANMAQQLLREGKTMVQIRAAVDARFGGGAAPGTDTPLPPA